MKTITTRDKNIYKQVSRWIHIKDIYVTKKHSLSDYADFSDSDDNKGLLLFFTYKNKNYALSQFIKLSYPDFYDDEEGKLGFIGGYDCTNYYKPLFCEISDCGEYIRLYQLIEYHN